MTGNVHVIYLAEVQTLYRNDTPFSVDKLYQTVPLDRSIVCRILSTWPYVQTINVI
jgi:hypothetical protein